MVAKPHANAKRCVMANRRACVTRVCHAARRINDAISWEKGIDFRLGRTSASVAIKVIFCHTCYFIYALLLSGCFAEALNRPSRSLRLH
jgi:hypothetical protein